MLALCFLYDSFLCVVLCFCLELYKYNLMYNNIDIKIACVLHINLIDIFFDIKVKRKWSLRF